MLKRWMIYGAYGYTGELIAREAVRRGMQPVLAGRNIDKLRPLAEELQLKVRAFPLDANAAQNLSHIDVVLHCAGPFRETSAPLVDACLAAGVHYLDITGEIAVFEQSFAKNAQAKRAGVVLCSGSGFDVIPTDCVALKLKELLPDATQLSLGFDSDSGVSPGTYKTMIQGLGSGSAERRDGKIVSVPLGSQQRTIDFGRGKRQTMGIPWGDVSTAFHTTAIPNISTWIPTKKTAATAARLLNILQPMLSSNFIQRNLNSWVDKRISGPDETLRSNSPAFIWGEARNAADVTKVVRIQTANVYDLTVYGALEVVSRLLEREFEGGSYTPALLFGADLVENLPGSGKFEVDTFFP